MYRVAGVTSVNIDSLPRKSTAVQNVGPPKRRTFQVVCPLVIAARTFGLLPCCLGEQCPSVYRDNGANLIWLHCLLHLALVVYSVLTVSFCLLFAVTGVFYVILMKKSDNVQFAIFDGILVWQAALLSGHFLFVRNRLRLYFRLLDVYVVTYQAEKFNRDRTATVIAFAERQKNVRSSYSQTNSQEPLEPSLERIFKTSKLWCFFLSIVAVVTVCCVMVQGVWSQMEYNPGTVTPMVGIAQWIAVRKSSRLYVFMGTAVDCFSIAYNVIPQVMFVGCALPLIYLIQHFNTKTSRCSISELDTDLIASSHYRMRCLLKALDDCFSVVVFVTIVGDFFQLICGTYLGCSLLRMDARCSRYFARQVMLVLRLCLVMGIGVALQEKVQGLLPTLEEYSSRSLLNTEKLKILTLFQILPSCGITGCSFFTITRNFAAKAVAFSVAYGIVLWKLTS